ncbi:T9SS type A sorting domain-containing protein [bacterium]
MKRLITFCIIFLLLQAYLAFGLVDANLAFVSHTRGAIGAQSTIVVRVEMSGDYAYDLYEFKGRIKLGAGLLSVLDGEPDLNVPTTVFPTTDYSRIAYRSGELIVFDFDFTGSTEEQCPIGSWETVLTATIYYTETANVTTEIKWESYSASFNLPPPVSATGTTTRDAYLLGDISLPVEMSDMFAEYTYEEGGKINWITQSEINVEGFHVYRADSENGDLIRVTDQMISGQGTSSSATEYEFIDRNVNWDSDYYYYIQEISPDFNQDNTFHGAIKLQTLEAPNNFKLSSNYPNPFNPSTEIQFEIVEGGIIDLSVYNLIGQKVATLVNEEKPAGIYSVPWFGRNDIGQEMPTGVYLYRLVAPEGIEVRKMMKVE